MVCRPDPKTDTLVWVMQTCWATARWDIYSSKASEQVGLSASLSGHLGVQGHLAEACIVVAIWQGWRVEVPLIQQSP